MRGMEEKGTLQTPLHAWHMQMRGKMVDFAGYALPVFYAGDGGGLIAEHLHTRAHASIFDVSHMGQLALPADTAALDALAGLMPADPRAIQPGASKYTVLMNEDGGVVDDCIVSNDGERGYFIVINASRKAVDIPYLRAALPNPDALHEHTDRALVAVQGPAAAAAVTALLPAGAELKFMQNAWVDYSGGEMRISRCGYTGEDGFEVSLPADAVTAFVDALMQNPAVRPAGLGARDSLRLEAGLCLYGNELDEETSPIEAGLLWSIPKARRGGSGYRGAATIAEHIGEGGDFRLVGLIPASKVPVRAGATLFWEGNEVGEVTSGVHSPTLSHPIAMAYLDTDFDIDLATIAEDAITAEVRGKRIPCKPARLPFVPHRYYK